MATIMFDILMPSYTIVYMDNKNLCSDADCEGWGICPCRDWTGFEFSLAERINQLVAIHGSLCAVSEEIVLNKGYLSRLRSGAKDNPSDDKLAALGLKREVTIVYKRI
jgi:hypothetical protein